MKKKVPYYRQETPFTCGAACLRMILSYLGKNLSEYELALLTESEIFFGTTCKLIAKAGEKLGFNANAMENLSLDDLKDFLDKGLVPIVLVNTGKYLGEKASVDGHFIIIKKINDELTVMDPSPDIGGKDIKISKDIFNKAWSLSGFQAVIIEKGEIND